MPETSEASNGKSVQASTTLTPGLKAELDTAARRAHRRTADYLRIMIIEHLAALAAEGNQK